MYTSGPIIAGAEPYAMPLVRSWIPAGLTAIRPTSPGALLLYVNYLNNPTGAVTRTTSSTGWSPSRVRTTSSSSTTTRSEITYDGYRPPLVTPGAADVGIEVFCHEDRNMTGWRPAPSSETPTWCPTTAVKTNIDSGMFEAVQEASVARLPDQSSVAEMCEISHVAATRWSRPAGDR